MFIDDEDDGFTAVIIDTAHRDEVLERIEAMTTQVGNVNSFSLWAVAWQDMMCAYGYPKARLYPVHEHHHLDDEDETRVNTMSYGWETDQDQYIEAYLAQSHWHPSRASWLSAHYAFMDVDALRPAYIERSEKLQEFIDVFGNNPVVGATMDIGEPGDNQHANS